MSDEPDWCQVMATMNRVEPFALSLYSASDLNRAGEAIPFCANPTRGVCHAEMISELAETRRATP